MRFTNIQALRFFAAVSVVILHGGTHSAAFLDYRGDVPTMFQWSIFNHGVTTFFVISGFVLTHSLQSCSFRKYLVLRFWRLYPAYWGAVLIAVALPYTMAHWGNTRSMLKAMSLLPWGPDSPTYSLSLVEWSLVHELVFSLSLPLFALFGRVRGVLVGSTLWLGSILYHLVQAKTTYFPMFPTVGELHKTPAAVDFILGVYVYFLRNTGRKYADWAWPTLLVMVGVSTPYAYATGRVDWVHVSWAVSSAILVWWASVVPQLASDNFLVRHGDRSYGIYLLHVPVMQYMIGVGKAHGWLLPADSLVIAVGLTACYLGMIYGAIDLWFYGRVRRWVMGKKPVAADPTPAAVPASEPIPLNRAA